MSKRMPRSTGPQTIKALGKLGWQVDRYRGDHAMLRPNEYGHTISVPDWGNKPLKLGTLRAIMRSAELTVDEFRQLL